MQLLFAALALDALFSSATLAGAHVGALVVEPQSGRVVYERHADDAFVPASTMKLIVGSASLERLGDAFAFRTALATDGSTLYLQGGGDPLLATADARDAATTLRALGATAFPGGLRGDASRYDATLYPDGWQIDDLPYDYAAPASALSFEENVTHITLAPAANAGDPPAMTFAPGIQPPCVELHAITGPAKSEDTTTLAFSGDLPVFGDPKCIVVQGSLPLGSAPVTLDASVLHPELNALRAFAQAFTAQGLTATLPGPDTMLAATPPGARVVWTHLSQRLPELLRAMWQPSDNLLAETLLQELGVANPGQGDTRERGIRVEREWLQSLGVDPQHTTIADGSGMSAYDRVTPRTLVAVLDHDWNGPERANVLAALPVAGKSGTLATSFATSPLAGNVIAKTGTSNHTRTLAGYLQTPHGTLVFALMVNDWMDGAPGATERLRTFQEEFLKDIRTGAGGVH